MGKIKKIYISNGLKQRIKDEKPKNKTEILVSTMIGLVMEGFKDYSEIMGSSKVGAINNECVFDDFK